MADIDGLLRVPRSFNDTVLWPEFLELDRELRPKLGDGGLRKAAYRGG